MNWLAGVQELREARRAGVLVTLASVRGHAPRAAGAKMVVAQDGQWGSIGGGNLEATVIARARQLLDSPAAAPETMTIRLTDRADSEHGQQCCGGEVSVLLEPLPVVPAVAIFGIGHVGLELARILARHDLELHLVDSRPGQTQPARLAMLDDAVARVHVHSAPVPEVVLGQVPPGTHVLVMTHDHAEDAAICDMALRHPHLGSIGLIGSASKWRRFERLLAEEGHDVAAMGRIRTPIGLPDLHAKDPASIAVAVAAELLRLIEQESPARQGTIPAEKATPG